MLTNELDLVTAFEGLSPEEARELTDRITTAVHKVITRSDAQRIRDRAIRRIMAEDGCIYPIARAKLEREKRAMRPVIMQKVAEMGCTREAAFLMLQEEKNQIGEYENE